MKIELAQYTGFCMGVRRALSLCMEAIRRKNYPIYTLGPIIHNSTVIDELESYGIKSITKTEDIKKGDYVLIRTHGVTPQVRHDLISKGAKIIDATCPKVARVQGIIRKHVANGYFIVIIGDHGHAETQGLLGYAENKGQVLSTKKEIQGFIDNTIASTPICVVAQTTQEIEIFDELCLMLQSHFSEIKIISTICDATRNRQEEIHKKASGCDHVFVVGGKNSANTTRLYEIAQKSCSDTKHIERAEEIDLDKMSKNNKVLVVAGASTPLWIVQEIVEELRRGSIINNILNITGSKYMFWISAFISMGLAKFFVNEWSGFKIAMLSLGGALLTSRGLLYYYIKTLDVFRLDYLYGKFALTAGLTLLVLLTIFGNYMVAFLLLYYGLLFYMVYKNIAVKRDLFFTLCNLILIAVPFL